jgi:hypothetical protein
MPRNFSSGPLTGDVISCSRKNIRDPSLAFYGFLSRLIRLTVRAAWMRISKLWAVPKDKTRYYLLIGFSSNILINWFGKGIKAK